MSESQQDLEALFEEISDQPATISAKPEDASPPVSALTASPVNNSSTAAAATSAVEPTASAPIYERLGGVVRVLHDSMRELGYDRTLADATSQITNVHERLNYIATLTEQAANKVLNATDEGIPAQDELCKKAQDIDERWTSLFEGKMELESFKSLALDSHSFAKATILSTEQEKARLLNIMMTQDFQDLTGQLIKKVTAITSTLERELAQILIDNAPPTKSVPVELMNGPSLPTSALGQDDVDNLLDSLGF